MSAAHKALVWGYKTLEKAFLGGADAMSIDDEKEASILRLAYKYASGGTMSVDKDIPIGQLPLRTIDFRKPLLSFFPELFLHPESRTNSDEEKKQKFCIPPKILLGNELNYPQKFPDDVDEQVKLKEAFEDDIKDLRKAFEADAKAFGLIGDAADFGQVSDDKLLMILEKYGASLSSEVDYISLFDYFRTVSAFAACLEKGQKAECKEQEVENEAEEEEIEETEEHQRFLIVCGDLSGIQDFVYGISSSGALKSLRARSFFLEFALEHVVTALIESVGVSRANVIYRGGGNFFMLLPNNEKARDSVKQISKAMNQHFYDRFEGRIYLAISTVPFDEDAVIWDPNQPDKFASFWRQGFELLEDLKQQKFIEQLDENDEVGDAKLFSRIDATSPGEGFPNNDNECQVCHREDMPEGETRRLYNNIVCIDCFHLFHLGDDLTDFHYVLRFNEKPERNGVIELPKGDRTYYFYRLSSQVFHENPSEGYDYVWGKNSVQITRPKGEDGAYYAGLDVPFSLLLISDVVVKAGDLFEAFKSEDGQIYSNAYDKEEENYRKLTQNTDQLPFSTTVSLSGLAMTARGIERIAALRMDVDNLGLLFSEGLHEQRRGLAHLATLSRNLTYFFSYYINRICHGTLDGVKNPDATDVSERLERGASKRMVTMVYSGGDDLFLVGAWSDVPEVAVDIRNHFKKFTCQSDLISHQRFLSISAGITVHYPKFPLYRMAKASETALSIAKNIAQVECKAGGCLRNYSQCYLYEENLMCKRKDAIALFVTDALRQRAKKLEEEGKKGRLELALAFDDFEYRVLDIVKQIKALGTIKTPALELELPHTFIQRLMLVTQVWQEEELLYIPSLKWTFSRTANTMKAINERGFQTLSVFLSGRLIAGYGEVMKTLHKPLMWVEWLSRLESEY